MRSGPRSSTTFRWPGSPLGASTQFAERSRRPRRERASSQPSNLRSMASVLVVDDDPVILKLLEVNFEMEGFTVYTASDGAMGLERARATMPDAIILDVMMPKMTGHEVAAALKDDP